MLGSHTAVPHRLRVTCRTVAEKGDGSPSVAASLSAEAEMGRHAPMLPSARTALRYHTRVPRPL